MKKRLLKNKISKKILLSVSAGIVVCSVVPGVTYALVTQYRSTTDQYAVMDEYYKNLTMNDVSDYSKTVVNNYEYALKNNAEYEDARTTGKTEGMLTDFETEIKLSLEEKKSLGYSPMEIFEGINERADYYKLQVLDWRYAMDQKQVYINSITNTVRNNNKLNPNQKSQIIADLTEMIDKEFETAKTEGLPATSFVKHFAEVIAKQISEKQGELAEKAVTLNDLSSLIGSVDLNSRQTVADDDSIELSKITVGQDITSVIGSFYTYNGYPLSGDVLPDYNLTAKVASITKINVFQYSIAITFSMIEKNSKYFTEPPAVVDLQAFDIYESKTVQNLFIKTDVMGSSKFLSWVTGDAEKPLISYEDFTKKFDGEKIWDSENANVISASLCAEICQYKIPEQYINFFDEGSSDKENNGLFFIRTTLTGTDAKTREITISISIVRKSTVETKEEIVCTLSDQKATLSASLAELMAYLVNELEILGNFIADSEKTIAVTNYYSEELEAKNQQLFDFQVFSLSVAVLSVVYYTTLAIIAASLIAVTFGATIVTFVMNTLSAAMSTWSVVSLSQSIHKIRKNLDSIKTIRGNNVFQKTVNSLKSNNGAKTNRMISERNRIGEILKSCSTSDQTTIPTKGVIKMFGGEYENIEVAIVYIGYETLNILEEFYQTENENNYLFVTNSTELITFTKNWKDWTGLGLGLALKFVLTLNFASEVYRILSSPVSIIYSLVNFFAIKATNMIDGTINAINMMAEVVFTGYFVAPTKWSTAIKAIWANKDIGIFTRINVMLTTTVQKMFGFVVKETWQYARIQKAISTFTLNPYVVCINTILLLVGLATAITSIWIR